MFEQSTRKCRWECYDGQAKFLDELKGKKVIARKRRYGPDYVNLFVKHHKEKMREFARQRGICNPIDVGLDKWGLERRRVLEAGLQAEEAEDDTSRLSELIALAETGLQAEEDDDAFFTQAVEAADEAEATYYR